MGTMLQNDLAALLQAGEAPPATLSVDQARVRHQLEADQMELTSGEPDVVGRDDTTGAVVYVDCFTHGARLPQPCRLVLRRAGLLRSAQGLSDQRPTPGRLDDHPARGSGPWPSTAGASGGQPEHP